MSTIEAKLSAMGLVLPPTRRYPSSNRCGCVRVGTILFVSGHPPQHPDIKIREPARLGADMTIEEGYIAARVAALLMLSTIKGAIGSLDKVKRVIRLFGMVNSTSNFADHPKVIDGASDLMLELFGPVHGCHARSAVGMASLPRGQAVEINGEFELLPDA